jgi:aminoglycoside phosphotransferase (APT) family kinase protein
LKVRDERNRSHRLLLSAQVLKHSELPASVPDLLARRYMSVGEHLIRQPMAYLPAAHMAVYPFPVDCSLPGLFDAADPAAMKRWLNLMWEGRHVRVRRVKVRQRGYTPHARAAFQYEVLCESKDDGAPEMRRFIGKMHAKKPAHRIHSDVWAVWRAGGQSVNLAPPVGYLGSIGLTLQEEVRGERLGGLVDHPGFTKWVRKTASCLASLHKLSIPTSTRRKPSDEVAGVERWSGVLTGIRSDLAPRVLQLRKRISEELERRTLPSGPIHADFHHTNILVDGNDIAIIDFDEMAFGDPMVDVGRFLASLRVPARRAFGDISALNGAGEAFLQTYLSHAGGDESRARLFESAALLIAAGSSFRIQRKNWEEEVELLVEEVERTFRMAVRHSPKAMNGDMRPPPLPPEERASWVNDAMYMQAVLDPHIHQIYDADLTSCRIHSHNGIHHGKVKYQLRGRRRDQKWRVTLEGIPWRGQGGLSTLRRLQALRSALEGSPGAPLLPRPVAYLRPLSLFVWEVNPGTRFSSIVGTRDAPMAAQEIARSLAALHGTKVNLDSRRSLEYELRNLRQKAEALGKVRPDLAGRVNQLLAEVEIRSLTARPRMAPVVRTVHPHHVLCSDHGVAFDKIEDVTLSHPFLDAGDFLARVAILGVAHNQTREVDEVAQHFRDSYRRNVSGDGTELETFEAAALLRLASTRSGRDPRDCLVDRLLDTAESTLAS